MKDLSRRTADFTDSVIRRMTRISNRYGAVNLSQGFPDFDPPKALLDRLVYGMDKYYGAEKGPALWAGKALALLLTCGYRPERGCDLFEEGMRRYCKHAQLRFLGSHAERHLGYDVPFMDAEKEARTRAFARELWDAVH